MVGRFVLQSVEDVRTRLADFANMIARGESGGQDLLDAYQRDQRSKRDITMEVSYNSLVM